MRRSISVIVICIAAGVAAAATLDGKATHSAVSFPLHAAPPAPSPAGTLALPPAATALTAVVTPAQVRTAATAWVSALWTRHPGQGPFDWLNVVAAITSPDLLAQLRTARPTLGDQLTVSESVVIDGVYPSAVDPHTVTVTCEARIVTTTGPVDQPCATTVTVETGPAGNPVVTAFQ